MNNTEPKKENIGDIFINYLTRHKNDRGIMSALKCGLRPALKHRAWPFISKFGGIANDTDSEHIKHKAEVVRTVAGIFASHPECADKNNFGHACQQLMDKDELKELHDPKKVGPVSRRFQYLLASEKAEICERVVRFINRLKTKGISVNYSGLFWDLLKWDDNVKANWAKSFWKIPEEIEQ